MMSFIFKPGADLCAICDILLCLTVYQILKNHMLPRSSRRESDFPYYSQLALGITYDTIFNMKSNTSIDTKNQFVATVLVALITLFALPHSAAALSCMNPTELIPQYATQDRYTVALIEAGAVETVGGEHDQSVTTKILYKGELGTTDTVTFTFDETWSYLCSGGPAEEGTEVIYVLTDKQVVQTFLTDSELARSLIDNINTPEIQPTETTVEEAEKVNLMRQIISLLQQIISLLAPDTEAEEKSLIELGIHDTILGLTTEEAKAYATATGVDFRLGMIDGEPLPVTMDYRIGRITAEVKNDVVTGYSVE